MNSVSALFLWVEGHGSTWWSLIWEAERCRARPPIPFVILLIPGTSVSLCFLMYRVRIVTWMFLPVGEFCGPPALYASLCLSSRGGCVLTDQQTPRLPFQVGLLWRNVEGVVKALQVWAWQHVGGAGDCGGEFKGLCCSESAEEMKGIPGKQITRVPEILFRLTPDQEEWQAKKLQVWMFLLQFFPSALRSGE